MKICFIVSDFVPKVGGISTFNTHLAAGLAQHPGVEHVLVIALQGQVSSVEEVSPMLAVRSIPGRTV